MHGNVKEAIYHKWPTNQIRMLPFLSLLLNLFKMEEVCNVQNQRYTEQHVSDRHERSTNDSQKESHNECDNLQANINEIL